MKRGKTAVWAIAIGLAALVAGAASAKEPDHIVVQHVLISFAGRIEGKDITRSKKVAKALAYDILDRAVAGEDFDAMVKEYTDDSYPGIFKLANLKQPVLAGERGRREMVAKFGDTAFRLDVDEIAIAVYNSMTSPFGYHVIKRLE